MRALLFVLLWPLTSLAQTYIEIDYNRPPPGDFPKLRMEVVYGDEEQMKRWCSRVPEANQGKVVGCSKLHFQWDLCMVFLSTKNEDHLKHEKAHCEGYGHVGIDRTPVDEWREYRASKNQ
jgi:hypothetical protein